MSVQLIFKMIVATFLSFFTAFGGLFGGAAQKDVCMIAHRGYSGVYHENSNNGSSLTVENTTIDTCYSTSNAGGGVYTTALAASFTRDCCAAVSLTSAPPSA